MVDLETRVFAGTPVTFAKIPGDPVKFVPLQYSLMPFPVRFSGNLLKIIYSPREYLIFVEKIDRKTGIDSVAGRPRATRFCSISPRKSRESIFFVPIAASTCTDSAFSFPLETDIAQFGRESFVRQRHFEGS